MQGRSAPHADTPAAPVQPGTSFDGANFGGGSRERGSVATPAKAANRHYEPLRERRQSGAQQRQLRHPGTVIPGPPNADIEPLAKDRIRHANGDGRYHDVLKSLLVAGPPASEHQQCEQQRRTGNQQVAASAVHDGERNLRDRSFEPDCIKWELKCFPSEVSHERRKGEAAENAKEHGRISGHATQAPSTPSPSGATTAVSLGHRRGDRTAARSSVQAFSRSLSSVVLGTTNGMNTVRAVRCRPEADAVGTTPITPLNRSLHLIPDWVRSSRNGGAHWGKYFMAASRPPTPPEATASSFPRVQYRMDAIERPWTYAAAAAARKAW